MEVIAAWRIQLKDMVAKKFEEVVLNMSPAHASSTWKSELDRMFESSLSTIDLTAPMPELGQRLQASAPLPQTHVVTSLVSAMRAGVVQLRDSNFKMLDSSPKAKRSKLYVLIKSGDFGLR